VDALELEAKVEDSEQESDIELIQTQNDSKLILQGDSLPTFEAGEADLNVSKGSEHDSSYNHHLSHKGSVHSDKVEPESQSRADEIDAEVQDVVETMIEEMQPSAEILKQEEPRVQPEEQDISFEIPEYVMIDGFRVQFSEVEHHVDSRGRLLLPTGEYIWLLHPKSVQMPINQHVDSGDEGQGTLNDSTTFQAHEDVSELANFSEKAQPGLSVELLVDFKHKEENDVSTIKQVTEKDKSFSQEGSIEQEQDTGLCVELVASTKLNDDTDQTPN
jgi:hypothetical protein